MTPYSLILHVVCVSHVVLQDHRRLTLDIYQTRESEKTNFPSHSLAKNIVRYYCQYVMSCVLISPSSVIKRSTTCTYRSPGMLRKRDCPVHFVGSKPFRRFVHIRTLHGVTLHIYSQSHDFNYRLSLTPRVGLSVGKQEI